MSAKTPVYFITADGQDQDWAVGLNDGEIWIAAAEYPEPPETGCFLDFRVKLRADRAKRLALAIQALIP